MDKETKMFMQISSFKRRAKEAPVNRFFKQLQQRPNLATANHHVAEYRKAWPQDPESMSVQAVLLLAQQQPQQALDILNAATDLRPDIGKLWSNKAVAHVTLGNPEHAINCANIAIQYTPSSDPIPFNIKGIALAQLGKKNKAIQVLRHSLFLDDLQAKTHRNLASIYSNCSMTTDAAKHYKKSLQIDPYFDKAYVKYTRCLTAIGKKDEALAVMAARSTFYLGKSTVKPVDQACMFSQPKYKMPAPKSPGHGF